MLRSLMVANYAFIVLQAIFLAFCIRRKKIEFLKRWRLVMIFLFFGSCIAQIAMHAALVFGPFF